MARTIKRPVSFGGEFAFPVSAIRGNGKQFIAPANDEKSSVTITGIDCVRGVTVGWTHVDRFSLTGTAAPGGLAARYGQSRCE